MTMNKFDKTYTILLSTNDGDDLSPFHLRMIELVINNGEKILNEDGLVEWNKLYNDCKNKQYTKPFHFGVEHMTKDHTGFIYFKGIQVEHFSHSSGEDELKDTQELADWCMDQEKQGLKISAGKAMFRGVQKRGYSLENELP